MIAAGLKQRKESGQKGLIVYLTAGYPDLDATYQAVMAAEAAGADAIEIGIPFSDPIADGPVIQKAATEALKRGVTAPKILELIRRIRRSSSIPLAVMTYVNTVLHYSPQKFIADFSAAGVAGLIIPDLPMEESGFIQAICREYPMELISFIAPTSGQDRIAAISKEASGFLYCISSTGVTGVKRTDYQLVEKIICQASRHTTIPIAVGFGIGSPEVAREAAKYADAVIVGSAVVQRMEKGDVASVRDFLSGIRRELDRGGL